MNVKILGTGCANCRRLEGLVKEVASEAGLQLDIEKVTEILTDSGESVTLLGEVIPAEGEHRVVYNGHLDLAR